MKKTEVKAEMSGTVIEISCSVGSTAVEGEALFIMDSMKMEMPLPATASGKVTEVFVEVGEVVNGGQVVAVIESN